ncbi:MAG: DUF4034 domain-containing protein [Bacteroidetes bacterium]|nr:DUF4034 domain-containing protein [Bacteroidota bacterium]
MKNKILAVVVACAMLLAILLGFIWQGKNDAFSNPRKPVETISLNDWVKLREMLQNKQFNELNSVLDGYQRLFELNHVDEYRIYDSFLAFRTTSPSYENLIQEWLEATPDQYQPYLGIAEYYYAKAWQSRGEKYAKDTSSEQFLGMNFYLQKAHENLTIALELNPHLMIAYNMLLGMSMAVGDSETEDEIIEKTSEMFPASFLIKYTALSAKEPQWGGSCCQ